MHRKRSLYMCGPSVAGGFQTSDSISFLKDGRKIRVGDCAFFKPPQDSPPFIGIIRCLVTGKESKLNFSVNWLYRASEVEIVRGTQLESAPNEIFYSFHEDEVPAGSLLHPCKVAFLPKGVDLPSGISSFICRRVYDTDQKCLWWLTDQNYINKRQEEVDHLISKTREEMHAALLSDSRSPNTKNELAHASQVKTDSHAAQAVSSFVSHGKGKKRAVSDPDSEPVKRLHLADEGDSYQSKSENRLNSEIASITDQGGLVDYASVQKLVQLMMPDKADKNIDLTGRSTLADVVAATDNFDCLSWFVQLKGLSVFDGWLQEIQKGKIGDGNFHEDGDKLVEDLLLVLLRALYKLPVNLRALQMCNIGKSVNQLRSHKNSEIQRKARSLVDTWKKRVEAEMNTDDGKPGSSVGATWHGKHTSDPSQGGGHRNAGTSENAMKSSSPQLYAPRTVSPKPSQGDYQTTASTSPEYSKSALSPAAGVVVSNDAQLKTAAVVESPDHLTALVKEKAERSSSSSQSHSQSSSSVYVKTTESSEKEDPRSSTAGSVGTGEMLRHASWPERSVSSLQGPVAHGASRDGRSNRSSLQKNIASEKLSQSMTNNEKTNDEPVADGNIHKLIVKIPNRMRSLANSANVGSINECCPSYSRVKSPACLDKHEKLDKVDASQLNDTLDVTTKSLHISDSKDVLTGSDEANGTSGANHNGVGETTRKVNELVKIESPAAHITKPRKTHEPSFGPLNALVESCVKHCEANSLISDVDNIGINLLASVAASEMSECDSVATDSLRNTAVVKDFSPGIFERSLNVDDNVQELTQCTDKVKEDTKKQDESTYIAENGKAGISSTNEDLAAELSNLSLPKNQDDAQLCNSRVISSNKNSLTLTPDGKVGNIKEINVSKSEVFPTEVEYLECARWSNDGLEKATKVFGGGLLMKASPLTEHSDPIGADDKIPTPDCPGIHVDSEKADMDAERLCIWKHIIVSNPPSSIDIDQHQNKNEDPNNKLGTTELYNKVSEVNPVTSDYCHLVAVSSDYNRECKDGSSQNKEASGKYNVGSDLNKRSATKMSECLSTDAPHAAQVAGLEKLAFDLNEGIMADEVKYEEPKSISGVSYPAAVHIASHLPFSVASNRLPVSITVAAAAKGAFVPPEDLLRTRGELGWKGSAATSAFRPAEPRKISETKRSISAPANDPGKSSRQLLNIDLNAPDESMQYEAVSHNDTGDQARNHRNTSGPRFGGLELDLNQIDEVNEVGQFSSFSNHKLEDHGLSFIPGNIFKDDFNGRKQFDLNNGPELEEVAAEASRAGLNALSNLPSRPPVVGLQMNNGENGSFASWVPQGSMIPAVFPDRGDQAFSIATTSKLQRMYYTSTGSTPFVPDGCRGPVLSSLPALSFPSAPYQQPFYPYGATYQAPSATLSSNAAFIDVLPGGMNSPSTSRSQYHSHPGVVSSSFARPYFESIPEGRRNGWHDNSNKWRSHGLDLNSGLSIEVGGNDTSPFALRQLSVASSQAFTEEQVRMIQASGLVLKRKKPDGSWDAEKPKQQCWPQAR